MLFLVNEQKYFASTDGSYIDQDMHRIWAPMSASPPSTRRPASSAARDGLSAPMGMGYEYLDGAPGRQGAGRPAASPRRTATPTTWWRTRAPPAHAAPRKAHGAKSVEPGKYDLVLDPVAPVAHHPRIGRPPDRARPRARLRGQLRRHQLRHARQVAEQELQVRQPSTSTSSPTRPSPARWARSATTTKA